MFLFQPLLQEISWREWSELLLSVYIYCMDYIFNFIEYKMIYIIYVYIYICIMVMMVMLKMLVCLCRMRMIMWTSQQPKGRTPKMSRRMRRSTKMLKGDIFGKQLTSENDLKYSIEGGRRNGTHNELKRWAIVPCSLMLL